MSDYKLKFSLMKNYTNQSFFYIIILSRIKLSNFNYSKLLLNCYLIHISSKLCLKPSFNKWIYYNN